MCIGSWFIALGLAVVAVTAIFIYRALFASIAINFQTMTPLLDRPERQDTFFRSYLRGFYKGRRIVFLSPHFNEGRSQIFYVEPVDVPRQNKRYAWDHPRPTPETRLIGRRIQYWGKGRFMIRESYYKRYTREELTHILDELTKAAEIVARQHDA